MGTHVFFSLCFFCEKILDFLGFSLFHGSYLAYLANFFVSLSAHSTNFFLKGMQLNVIKHFFYIDTDLNYFINILDRHEGLIFGGLIYTTFKFSLFIKLIPMSY